MSDIKAGDLVMIVRGHDCAIRIRGGIPWRISRINPQVGGGWQCKKCGAFNLAPDELWGATPYDNNTGGFPLGWLKKIDPPAESERIERREELTA